MRNVMFVTLLWGCSTTLFGPEVRDCGDLSGTWAGTRAPDYAITYTIQGGVLSCPLSMTITKGGQPAWPDMQSTATLIYPTLSWTNGFGEFSAEVSDDKAMSLRWPAGDDVPMRRQ